MLVARGANRLRSLAAELALRHNILVRTLEVDLMDVDAVKVLTHQTRDLEIGLLVLSAGMELHGQFITNSYAGESSVLRLNALVPMQLAHVFGQRMAVRGRGGIIFVASTFGHQAVPYFANDSASKAYILGLGQALNYEFKKAAVDVMVLSPGLTSTEMTQNMAGVDFSKMPIVEMRAESVVKKAIDSLGWTPVVIPGGRNIFMDIIGKFTTPRWLLTRMYGFLVSRAMKIET